MVPFDKYKHFLFFTILHKFVNIIYSPCQQKTVVERIFNDQDVTATSPVGPAIYWKFA